MDSDRTAIWSWGGGVQTIAILCLIAWGKLPKPALAVMANTERERTSTWRYLENYARPVLDDIGLDLVIVGHEWAKVDIYGGNGDILIPAYTTTGKLPTFCSNEWKKRVVYRYLRSIEYGPNNPVSIWMGMSLDEIDRMKVSDTKWVKNHYPLIFDVPKRRYECLLVIKEFGLPPPSQSSCWMCPNIVNAEWRDIRDNDPADFAKAVAFGQKIRNADQRGGVWLHKDRVPLDEANLTDNSKSYPLLECAGGCFT